jgi:hypothetical protein
MPPTLEAIADTFSPQLQRERTACGNVLTTGSHSLDELAVFVALKGVDFETPRLTAHS